MRRGTKARRHGAVKGWIVFFLLLIHAAAHAEDVVERRGGIEPLRGTIVVIGDDGVTIRSAIDRSENGESLPGPSVLVPWDQVKRVQWSSPDPTLDVRLAIAEDLWRARSRLQRHDAAMAEPLFEKLFDRFRGQTHETALIVAEGLLRCRLDRFANDLAVIPALEVIRMRRADVTTDRFAALPIVFDEEFALCPLLPPAWMNATRLTRLLSDLERYDAKGDEVVTAMAALYGRAAHLLHNANPDAANSGLDDDRSEAIRQAQRHPGVRLLRDMVTLIDRDIAGSDRRRAAESRLVRQSDEERPWIEAWYRYFDGASLITASGAGHNERGIAMLAHLPARFAQSQPFLAGLALHHIIAYMEQDNQAGPAASLRDELTQRFPRHPAAMEWNRRRMNADERVPSSAFRTR